MRSNSDDIPRVRPSSRNGNALPLRRPGERIGGRKKGTPNKVSPEFKRRICAATQTAGRVLQGEDWLPSDDPEQATLEAVALYMPGRFLQFVRRMLPRANSRNRLPAEDDPLARDPKKPFESAEELKRAMIAIGMPLWVYFPEESEPPRQGDPTACSDTGTGKKPR